MATKTDIIEFTIEHTLTKISFSEVCQQYGISEQILFEFLENGLIAEISAPSTSLVFESSHLQRILSACRLHQDLEINPNGVILALELMDELTELRQELAILRRHMHDN